MKSGRLSSELDGVRVCAETSRRMACDAARVAMCHRDFEVVSVGRRTRTIPPHIRRALEERDRGCRYPGCASRFTEAHHVKHWADGGETSLANTILLCRRHHRLVHEGKTRMALDRDGKAAFFTRAGQVIGSAPPPPEQSRKLPQPPAPPPDRLSNGAPRFVDAEVPLSLELEALEAVARAGEDRLSGDGITRPRAAAAKPGTPACRNGTRPSRGGGRKHPPPRQVQQRQSGCPVPRTVLSSPCSPRAPSQRRRGTWGGRCRHAPTVPAPPPPPFR